MPEFRAMLINNQIKPLEGYEEEYNRIAPDVVLNVKVTSPRSRKHQGLFFAAIENAFSNWPHSHKFKPENSEHLRQFLECKAGYREALTVELTGDKGFIASLSGAIAHAQSKGTKGKQKYVFLTNTLTDVWVVYAQSIAYDKLSQEDFNTVSHNVSEVLKEHTGVSLEEFKMQGKAA